MKLSEIHTNPNNPRLIKDDKFRKLVMSVKDFPKMMELRPIIVDDSGMILGGNMRYLACKELGMEEIPDEWVKVTSKLSDEEKKKFIVQDNIQHGQWDFDILFEEYDVVELLDFGVDIPKTEEELEKYENLNPLMPIVPAYDEKYSMLVIFIKSELDLVYIKNKLNLVKMKSYKNSRTQETMVIDVDHFRSAIE